MSVRKQRLDSEWLWIAIPAILSAYYLGIGALLFWVAIVVLAAGYKWGWTERDKDR